MTKNGPIRRVRHRMGRFVRFFLFFSFFLSFFTNSDVGATSTTPITTTTTRPRPRPRPSPRRDPEQHIATPQRRGRARGRATGGGEMSGGRTVGARGAFSSPGTCFFIFYLLFSVLILQGARDTSRAPLFFSFLFFLGPLLPHTTQLQAPGHATRPGPKRSYIASFGPKVSIFS